MAFFCNLFHKLTNLLGCETVELCLMRHKISWTEGDVQVDKELNNKTVTQAVLDRQIINYKKDVDRMHIRNHSGLVFL